MIRIALNGMIYMMLAKFIINDLPHAAGLLASPNYGVPPTPGQLRYIAVLCQQLKITTPYEEQVKTFGEAGRLIRELEEERKHRKRLRSGNPTVHVETNEEISQNRVSGVAIAWVGSKDVGSLHYGFEVGGMGEILFMQVDEEYRGLGIGKKMYQAVESLARGYGVKKLTSEVGIPGYGDIERAKRFWESVGFIITNDYAEKQLKNSSPNTAVGTCYSDAWRFLIKQGEGHLVHGSVQLSAEGPRVNHAWVELSAGWIWEPQTDKGYTVEDFRIMGPVEDHRYTVEEAAIMAARTGKLGPWTAEERNMWL